MGGRVIWCKFRQLSHQNPKHSALPLGGGKYDHDGLRLRAVYRSPKARQTCKGEFCGIRYSDTSPSHSGETLKLENLHVLENDGRPHLL